MAEKKACLIETFVTNVTGALADPDGLMVIELFFTANDTLTQTVSTMQQNIQPFGIRFHIRILRDMLDTYRIFLTEAHIVLQYGKSSE